MSKATRPTATTTARIRRITRHGARGWRFTVDRPKGDKRYKPYAHYMTGGTGNGLWMLVRSEWIQLRDNGWTVWPDHDRALAQLRDLFQD